jgi:hypothetical protein
MVAVLASLGLGWLSYEIFTARPVQPIGAANAAPETQEGDMLFSRTGSVALPAPSGPPPLDLIQPKAFETATFALG